jgi:hypothetical protein
MIWGYPETSKYFFVNVYNTSTTADSPYFFPQYFISRCLAEELRMEDIAQQFTVGFPEIGYQWFQMAKIIQFRIIGFIGFYPIFDGLILIFAHISVGRI